VRRRRIDASFQGVSMLQRKHLWKFGDASMRRRGMAMDVTAGCVFRRRSEHWIGAVDHDFPS